jgi:hypothetical protein
MLARGLAAWRSLPDAERRAGSVEVPEPKKIDRRFVRTPPQDGLILNVSTRILERDGKGGYRRGSCDTPGGDQAARDHLWITKGEWQALLPADPQVGTKVPMPPSLANRLVRYHLIDNTRGEPPTWEAAEVRRSEWSLVVDAMDDVTVRVRLDGEALLATKADLAKADRGYDLRLIGSIRINRKTKTIERFDVVALGEHWGEGEYNAGARRGRQPLGIFFELCPGRGGADVVAPQAARDFEDYIGRGE